MQNNYKNLLRGTVTIASWYMDFILAAVPDNYILEQTCSDVASSCELEHRISNYSKLLRGYARWSQASRSAPSEVVTEHSLIDQATPS